MITTEQEIINAIIGAVVCFPLLIGLLMIIGRVLLSVGKRLEYDPEHPERSDCVAGPYKHPVTGRVLPPIYTNQHYPVERLTSYTVTERENGKLVTRRYYYRHEDD